jgi:hypothetical protein
MNHEFSTVKLVHQICVKTHTLEDKSHIPICHIQNVSKIKYFDFNTSKTVVHCHEVFFNTSLDRMPVTIENILYISLQ